MISSTGGSQSWLSELKKWFKESLRDLQGLNMCMHVGINISSFITKTLLQNFVHFIDITKYNDNLQFSR